MKEVLSWLDRWARRAGTRDFCSALVALVGTVQKIVFLTIHYSNSFDPNDPIAEQTGQAAALGSLSLSMSLFSKTTVQI